MNVIVITIITETPRKRAMNAGDAKNASESISSVRGGRRRRH
jgi:hypothetical protein